jgi:hypothetical protein
MKTEIPPAVLGPDKETKIIPIRVVDAEDSFDELNAEYHYTAANRKTGKIINLHARMDGCWFVGEATTNFRIVSREAATRIVNSALDDNHIIAYLHLSTGQTGAVGRKGAVQS